MGQVKGTEEEETRQKECALGLVWLWDGREQHLSTSFCPHRPWVAPKDVNSHTLSLQKQGSPWDRAGNKSKQAALYLMMSIRWRQELLVIARKALSFILQREDFLLTWRNPFTLGGVLVKTYLDPIHPTQAASDPVYSPDPLSQHCSTLTTKGWPRKHLPPLKNE